MAAPSGRGVPKPAPSDGRRGGTQPPAMRWRCWSSAGCGVLCTLLLPVSLCVLFVHPLALCARGADGEREVWSRWVRKERCPCVRCQRHGGGQIGAGEAHIPRAQRSCFAHWLALSRVLAARGCCRSCCVRYSQGGSRLCPLRGLHCAVRGRVPALTQGRDAIGFTSAPEIWDSAGRGSVMHLSRKPVQPVWRWESVPVATTAINNKQAIQALLVALSHRAVRVDTSPSWPRTADSLLQSLRGLSGGTCDRAAPVPGQRHRKAPALACN